jgi:branched-chain amino acid aminotransferase
MPAFTKTDRIWLNGEMVAWDDAKIHITAHGLQYGTGVFEGMRSYDTPNGPAIFRLDAHMRRLQMSAKYYEIELPYTFEQLCAASLEVVRSNRLENSYLRPLAFYDSRSFAVWPKECPVTVTIIAVPGRQYFAGDNHGLRVSVSTIRRIDSSTLPPFVKACGHYTNSVRAAQEALRRGFDDAILVNNRGNIAEGSGANLFMVKNGTLITNDLDESILEGVTRDSVLQIAKDKGIPIKMQPMKLTDIEVVDEMFFCGTAVEITAIKEVDGRKISDGPGPITRELQAIFQDAVHGKLPQYKHWLSHIGAD